MKGAKTSWDLTLLYKSEKDPQIEKDMQKIERACAAFEKKYKNSNFTAAPASLLKALEESERLERIFNGSKPWLYFALRNELNSDDAIAGAEATKLEHRVTAAVNRIAFFALRIGKIPKKSQAKFLKSKSLAPYAYHLKRMFDHSAHQLSEKEEQLAGLLSSPGYTMWLTGNNKVVTQTLVKGKGKPILLSEVIRKIEDSSDKDRVLWQKALNEKLKEIAGFAEAELNAIYTFKKILDERRGFRKPYSATVLENENDEKEIETLVSIVTRHFSISSRFYRLHAKLLGKKKLSYADRAAKIGKIGKKFNFDKTLDIVRGALGRVDKKYATLLDSFVKNGQIDVYPRKGKNDGAFCAGIGENPTFILLNQVDNMGSVETLGHEMGHAIHGELSMSQPPRYQKYSKSTAETASTFFELVTLDEIEKSLSEKEKIIFLHSKIKLDIVTIFRQIACFNFEVELHERIRRDGMVSKGDIAKLMAKHMQSYMGKTVEVKEDDGYVFVTWSHIRDFFYVYSYAYGQLVSRALYEKWKRDPRYSEKIEKFLKAGRSMSPGDIFKSIGIDTSDPKFFEAGLKGIEADIIKLEKLVSKKAE